jgi:hypothetical protein
MHQLGFQDHEGRCRKGDEALMRRRLCALLFLSVVACASGGADEAEQRARERLKSLNRWERDELDVAENPKKYPGRKPSGETNGWIATHKQELDKLGYEAVWKPDDRQYTLRRKPRHAPQRRSSDPDR